MSEIDSESRNSKVRVYNRGKKTKNAIRKYDKLD